MIPLNVEDEWELVADTTFVGGDRRGFQKDIDTER